MSSLEDGKKFPLPEDPDPATFSEQQLEIVRRIYLHTDKSIWDQPGFKRMDNKAAGWDAKIEMTHLAYPAWRIEDFVAGLVTPAKRASASRALKRLVARGIVTARYGTNREKAKVVSLTDAGERLARLISE